MAGVVELRLPELYVEGHDSPPKPGWTGSANLYEICQMEEVVRGAMRAGRVSMTHGREELRLLSLCAAALRVGDGVASVPLKIHDEPWPVRAKKASRKEKSRQKKARRANRRRKKAKR